MTLSTIGRYEILSELAHGSMGVIFLAHDPFVQRSVIIKVLTYQFAIEEYHREFFQQEAKIIASLEHPYIVPVYDFGWIGSQPYIVMRYMEGGSLEDILKVRRLKLTEFSKILQRLCEALDAAHAQNIIHRDIKPANILFDIEKKAFLADFGIAKQEKGAGDGEDWVVGTPSYMSPEQCLSQPVGAPADVYALGVLLFKALTGQLPFAGSSLDNLMELHIHQPVPQISALEPDLPAEWQEIVDKAMAKSPEDRYTNAGELAEDVQGLITGRWYWRKL